MTYWLAVVALCQVVQTMLRVRDATKRGLNLDPRRLRRNRRRKQVPSVTEVV